MRIVLIAIVLAVFAASFVAQAQTDGPASDQPATPAAQAIPEASDAPAVNMERFCARNSQRYYPPRALSRRVDGDVVLDCSVSDDGALRECQVVDEQPRRMGFGDASLTLACGLRVTAETISSDDVQVYERDSERRLRQTFRWRLNS